MTSKKTNKTLRSEYLFGFGKQEKDNEIAGIGNHYEYKFRRYDPRLGRFLSQDPLHRSYPWNSTYAFAENRVIDGIDLEGLEYRYATDGRYLGQGNDRSSNLVELVTHTKVKDKAVEQTSTLTFNGMAISHSEFQQMGGIVYNETYKGDPSFKNLGAEDKLLISDAIVNKGANLTKQYPGLKGKNIFLQTTLDKVMYGKDSHEQRMSSERQNPGKDDKIPGTKISLNNIRTKHYAEFINTSPEDRNDNPEMKETNKAVIDGLRRDRPESDPNHRSDDTADGKYEWRGDGKTNTVR